MTAAAVIARPRLPSVQASDALVQLAAPTAGGVRDYWQALRDTWAARGLASSVVELDAAGARERPLAARLLPALSQGPTTLLVHFSGYGFHPRGLCDWLVDEVETALDAGRGRLRLATMFHELYASGPPWRSAFWLQHRQAAIATRLARASDVVFTNARHHADWLAGRTRPGTPIVVRPVFSTIGEPACPLRPVARRPQLVVFGSASTRARALARLPRHAAMLRDGGVEAVVEAGTGESTPWHCAALPLRRLGALDLHELRGLLGEARWALIDYPARYLGKSTVFAAYAAHGTVVLNTAVCDHDADGLVEGRHYHALGSPGRGWAEAPQRTADAARDWYDGHPLARQADDFADALAWPAGAAR